MRRMRTFPAIPQSVHAARRFATDALTGNPATMIDAVELMVSELATNCIRHERTSFHITILGSTQEIRVEVTDSGSGTPAMRSPGPDEPSGRGLQIVEMLSDSWGVEPEQPSGKTVWFTMPAGSPLAPGSDEIGRRRRIGSDAPALAGDPSSVQPAHGMPNGPTCQHPCGMRPYRVPGRPLGAGLRCQGRARLRRYCQHDEPGCHARSGEHLGPLR
jgi:anti-sigma regulatory factor (Ser/Thr protein kinase)